MSSDGHRVVTTMPTARTTSAIGSTGASSKPTPTCAAFSGYSSSSDGSIGCCDGKTMTSTKETAPCTSPGMVRSWESRTGPRSPARWPCICTASGEGRWTISTSLLTRTGRRTRSHCLTSRATAGGVSLTRLQAPPHDIVEPGAEEVLADQHHYVVGPRSVVVLIGK